MRRRGLTRRKPGASRGAVESGSRPIGPLWGDDGPNESSLHIYDRLGVRRLVNARGCATLAGGTIMDTDALRVYGEAASAFVAIEELQEAASIVIARVTGSEAGYVTPGAAAAVTLATAACMAGTDVEKMDRLPHAAGMPDEVLVQRVHRNPYDHMVRAAGAQLFDFGDEMSATSADMEGAITANTVAAFYHAQKEHLGLSLPAFIKVAHMHGVPVIVDAATSLPPASNLRRFIAEGADLVAFSGGKSLRGPQASGFLAGRQDLLLSVALQHQDMDVIPSTWTRRSLLERGAIVRPPEHGIGRAMKVGKEEIAALIVALEKYSTRDHQAEYQGWLATTQELVDKLRSISGLETVVREADDEGRPVPSAEVRVCPQYGLSAVELVRALRDFDPPILVSDYGVEQGKIELNPENLRRGEIDLIVTAVRALRRPSEAPI
jgi:seryl-tRNA(Sec) selenium transferase